MTHSLALRRSVAVAILALAAANPAAAAQAQGRSPSGYLLPESETWELKL